MKTNSLVPIWIHALMPGNFQGQNGPVLITPENIKQIAESYAPSNHEAPAVLGHPLTDDPAYGWISAADARDDGLWLNADLLPELAESIRNRKYGKVSVSLYNPDHPANPTPGKYHLKHLGFLGAQPPAVKGLKPIALADDSDQTTVIDFQELTTEKESPMSVKTTGADVPTSAPAASTANLAEQESQFKQRETALAERERKVKRAEIETQLTPYIQKGQLLPAQKPLFVALMERADGETVSLSENQSAKPLTEQITDYLATLPAQVNLQELSAPAAQTTPANTSSFSAPTGFGVDAERASLDAQVQAYSRKHGVTYVEALAAMGVN